MWKFRIADITIEIHISFFILVVIFFFLGNAFLAFCSIIFSFLHEIVHGIVAKRLGYRPKTISAGLFGGVLHLEEGYLPPLDALIINLSGPMFNLTTAMIFYLGYLIFPALWIRSILTANLILGLFNLMPFYPLDGGKIIGVYLSYFFGYGKAYIISKIFSFIFTILLFLLGLYLVQYSVINLLISVLAVNLYIVGRADSRYSFYRLMSIYAAIEKENWKWY